MKLFGMILNEKTWLAGIFGSRGMGLKIGCQDPDVSSHFVKPPRLLCAWRMRAEWGQQEQTTY